MKAQISEKTFRNDHLAINGIAIMFPGSTYVHKCIILFCKRTEAKILGFPVKYFIVFFFLSIANRIPAKYEGSSEISPITIDTEEKHRKCRHERSNKRKIREKPASIASDLWMCSVSICIAPAR